MQSSPVIRKNHARLCEIGEQAASRRKMGGSKAFTEGFEKRVKRELVQNLFEMRGNRGAANGVRARDPA